LDTKKEGLPGIPNELAEEENEAEACGNTDGNQMKKMKLEISMKMILSTEE